MMDWHEARHASLWRALPQGTDDLGHDSMHLLRVYQWALRIGADLGADLSILGAAALVHDLVAIPKDHVDRPKAALLSAQVAPPLLLESGYEPEEIESIVLAVSTASWSSGMAAESVEGQALQDADRLDALGAVGIARTFCVAQRLRSRAELSLYHLEDPLACQREPDDRRYAVDHFFVKLLRLPDQMHSEVARVEAKRRSDLMRRFLAELERELRVCA